MPEISYNRSSASVRKKAIWKVLAGITGALFGFVTILLLERESHDADEFEKILIVPLFYACLGAAELISGVKFQELGEKWERMTNFQQFFWGMLIVISGSVVVIYTVWFLFQHLR